MRRGQSVRVLRTNQIGVIEDMELIRKDGKVHKYCHLKMGSKPDLWMDASELGSVKETARITFSGDNGQELYITAELDHKANKMEISLTGKPENLLEHGDETLSSKLAATFLNFLKD